MKILVATTNPGKMKELSAILVAAGEKIEWFSLRDFPSVPEVEEDGDTFAANARKKALGYAQATGLWTLADDSGLMIDALNGDPGVRSARYAADECAADGDRKIIDRANFQKVLRLLNGTPDEKRTARFCCHLCLAEPGRILLESTGFVEGAINHNPIGEKGFGYDPIFYIPTAGKTAAQLDADEKNRISHRANALAVLMPKLKKLLS